MHLNVVQNKYIAALPAEKILYEYGLGYLIPSYFFSCEHSRSPTQKARRLQQKPPYHPLCGLFLGHQGRATQSIKVIADLWGRKGDSRQKEYSETLKGLALRQKLHRINRLTQTP